MARQFASKFLLALMLLSSGTIAKGWFNSGPTNKSNPAKKLTTKSQKPVKPPPPPKSPMPDLSEVPEAVTETLDDLNPITPGVWNSMTSAAISFASKLAPKSIKEGTNRAARVQVNRLPPTSFKVDLSDVPLIGKALSGTYAKVKDESKVKNPSVVIASPRDKFNAIQQASEKGNLEFSLAGILNSYLDIQLEPNRPGEAPVRLESPLIPKWPFAQRRSRWYRVSNCGNGETYFFDSKTGETQIAEPKELY